MAPVGSHPGRFHTAGTTTDDHHVAGNVDRARVGLGLVAEECVLGRMDLFCADEVFLTGSGARIVPVAPLDGQPIGTGEAGQRPITQRIMDAFPGFVLRHGTPV